MKMSIRSLVITSFLLITLCHAQAQGKLSATFRPAANFPVKDLGAAELKSGGGFEATFYYRFAPSLSAYAGWGWNKFAPQADNAGAHFEETGYRFGLQFIQPLTTESKLRLLLSAGGIMNHIESENKQGDIVDDTGHGMGWEVDAGLSIPIGSRWHLVPGIRYHSLSREMMVGNTETSVDLNYVSVGVGVSWTLVVD